MSHAELIEKLSTLDPCADAMNWIRARNFVSLQEAYDACEKPDWLMWLHSNTTRTNGIDSKIYVHLACDFAARVAKNARQEDRKVLSLARGLARKYANGAIISFETLSAADSAARAAYSAAHSAADSAADSAACAAYSAARAADSAACAARAADSAAYSAARAADSAADSAAYSAAHSAARALEERMQCKIIRKRIPVCPTF